jgi:hypothetical protein
VHSASKKKSLGSLTIGYSRGRIITFKLVDHFDIDNLASTEDFEVHRTSKLNGGEPVISVLGCHIRGIRKAKGPTHLGSVPYADEGFRWVKIEGAKYRLDREQITSWLEHWGTIESEITEDKIEYDSHDSDKCQAIGKGTYSVKMRLISDLPKFLPMFGKHIRLYYRGIVKKCSNCFGSHARRVCNQEKVPWITYVAQLMKARPEIPLESYGKWADYVREKNVIIDEPTETSSAPSCDGPAIIMPSSTNITKPTYIRPNDMNLPSNQIDNNKVTDPTIPKSTEPIDKTIATLSRLKRQGLVVSEMSSSPSIDTTTARLKTKSSDNLGRGRGRRKTSLTNL